jgi:hypothetical protein
MLDLPHFDTEEIAHSLCALLVLRELLSDKSLSKEERFSNEQCFINSVHRPLITDWEKSKEISKGKEITN